MDPCPVVVADDSPTARQALCDVVGSTTGLRLVASLGCGEQAVAFAATMTPLLVVLDVRMPGVSGIEAAALIAENDPAHIIVLASSDEDVSDALTRRPGLLFVPKSRLSGAFLLEAWRSRPA